MDLFGKSNPLTLPYLQAIMLTKGQLSFTSSTISCNPKSCSFYSNYLLLSSVYAKGFTFVELKVPNYHNSYSRAIIFYSEY